jgi:chemotaxis protein histidine kinase CheA/CheY-like chemotaxis protein
MMPEQQQRILGYFIEEAKDHLNTIEQGLLNLQATIQDPEMVNEVFRAAHSVKGGAAMLSLGSIQRTAHRLEDYFKILKETPTTQVDRDLESMFLQVFDGLQALLEELQGPFGLTEDKAQDVMTDIEPVFEQLEQHLNHLVANAPAVVAQPPAAVAVTGSMPLSSSTARREDSALKLVFSSDVPGHLREMLTLFKQPDSEASRKALQACCQALQRIGEQFDLEQWTDLTAATYRAVGNVEQTYRALAPVVIKELKRSQEQVLSGHAHAITIAPELEALLPLEGDVEADLGDIDSLLDDALSAAEEPDLTDLFATDEQPVTTAADDMAWLDLEETAAEESISEAADEFSFDLDEPLSEVNTNHSQGGTALPEPVVGTAELNSLADLFEGEVSELDSPWEEMSEPETATTDRTSPDIDVADDFSDLLDEALDTEESTDTQQDLADLFGDTHVLEADLDDEPLAGAGLDETDKTDSDFDALFNPLDDVEPDTELVQDASEGDSDDDLDDFLESLSEEEMTVTSEEVFALDAESLDLESLSTDSDTTATKDFNQLFDVSETEVVEESFSADTSDSSDASEAGLDLGVDDASVTDPDAGDSILMEADPSFTEIADPWSLEAIDDEEVDDSALDALDELWSETHTTDHSDEPPSDTERPESFALEGLDLDADLDIDAAFSASSDVSASNLEIDADTGLSDIFNAEGADQVGRDGTEALTSDEAVSVDWSEPVDDAVLDDLDLDLPDADTDFGELLGADSAAMGDTLDNPEVDLDALLPGDTELSVGAALDSDLDLGDLAVTETEPSDSIVTDEALDIASSAVLPEATPDPFVDALADDVDNGLEAELVLDTTTESEPDIDFTFAETESDAIPLSMSDAALNDLSESVTNSSTAVDFTEITEEEDFFSTESDSEAAAGDRAELDFDLEDELLSTDSMEESLATDQVSSPEAAIDDFFETPTPLANEASALEDLADIDVASLELDDSFATDPSSSENLADVALPDQADAPGSETYLDEAVTSNVEQELELPSWDTADLPTDAVSTESSVDEAAAMSEPDTEAIFADDIDETMMDIDALAEDSSGSDVDIDLNDLAVSAEASAALIDDTEAMAVDSALDDLNGLLDNTPGDEDGDETAPSALEADQADFESLDDLLDGEDLAVSDVDAIAVDGEASAALVDVADVGDADFGELDALLDEDEAPAALESLADTGLTDEFSDLEKLLEEADQTLGGGSPSMRATSSGRSPRRVGGVIDQTMRVSVKHLDNLNNLVGELVVNRNSLEQDQDRLRQFLDNLLFQVQQLNDVGQRMRDLYERSLLESSLLASRQGFQSGGLPRTVEHQAPNGGGHATGATFDALEMDRFTGFHTLTQEMVELIVRVRESASDIAYTVESTDQIARQFRQVTTQLQEGLNKARMVPFAQTADRLPRAVRDISIKCGKEARLVVEGRDTLIDKMILERLYDPMTHLVNNAITHGIESPEDRVALGKPREGTITVRAFYQGNQTVIYIADDGAGINPDVVKSKAIQKGMLTQADADSMSTLETYELLFRHGFSTRDKADDFAGRGVGMDVVRTALSEIRGSITIDSELGKGTSFTIRLPLTLSISKALSCLNNQARIAFPMDGVEDMFDVPKERIQTDANNQTSIQWRDTMLMFQPLSELLQFNRSLGRGRVYGGSQDEDMISIVVLRNANTYIGIQVDRVLGEQEIVIKQIEGPVPKPMGIAGATVLGDGRVMPIGDVLELIDIAQGRVRREASSSLWAQVDLPPEDEVVDSKTEPTVLIVDDSITVRELLSMSFNKVGYRVEQARDGQEAWEKMRSGLPCDLVFCDIEMPRMDGLELLSRMQKDSLLKQIPIAMLTSRGADRHRQMAVDLGASGYFTKPYLEEALLDAAQRMLKGEVLLHHLPEEIDE